MDDLNTADPVDLVADRVGEVLQELHDELAGQGVQTQCTHLQVQLPDDTVVEARYDPDPPQGEPQLTGTVRPA